MAGPTPGVGAHPRRHHGRGRRLPGRPPLPGVLRGLSIGTLQHQLLAFVGASPRSSGRRWPSSRTTSRRSSPTPPSASSATWSWPSASGPGPRRLPPLHPRLLQGLPVPRRRLGQPRRPPHLRHAQDGRAAQVHAQHVRHLRHRLPRPGRHLPAGRLLVQGRDPGRCACRARPTPTPAMLVIGCITAFMTAAYMTRAIWMTFFGEYRGQGTPHESPKVMTVPAVDPGRRAPSSSASSTCPTSWPRTASPLRFEHYVEPTFAFPAIEHPEFSFLLAGFSILLAVAGIALGLAVLRPQPGPPRPHRAQRARPPGATASSRTSTTSTSSTPTSSSRSIKGPIARGVYWFNQNVLDGVVNGAGQRVQGRGQLALPQRRPGGRRRLVNGSGAGGRGLRPVPPPHPDRQGAAVRRPPLRRRRRPRRRLRRSSSRSHRDRPDETTS